MFLKDHPPKDYLIARQPCLTIRQKKKPFSRDGRFWCSKHFYFSGSLGFSFYTRLFSGSVLVSRVSFRDTFKAAFQSQDQLLRLEQCCAQANKKGWGFVSGVTQQTHSSWFLQREGLLNMHIKKWYVWVYIWYLYRCQYTYLYMTYNKYMHSYQKRVEEKSSWSPSPGFPFFLGWWDPEKKDATATVAWCKPRWITPWTNKWKISGFQLPGWWNLRIWPRWINDCSLQKTHPVAAEEKTFFFSNRKYIYIILVVEKL